MKNLYDVILLERRSVVFGSSKSSYGNCIILAGGAGSGKGYSKENSILADFKTFDVDELKNKYLKLVKAGKIKADKEYDLKNPDDVSKIHAEVSKRKWKSKERENFWKQREIDSAYKKDLPNVCFDITAKDIEDIEEIVKHSSPLGYKNTIVWVVCNRDTAKEGNSKRDRHVGENIIDITHDGAYKTMNALFSNKYKELNDCIDYAWAVLSPGFERKLDDDYINDRAIKIKKDSSGNFLYSKKDLVNKFISQQQPKDYNAMKKNREKAIKKLEQELQENPSRKEEIKNQISALQKEIEELNL